jgi:hypothetical protein
MENQNLHNLCVNSELQLEFSMWLAVYQVL